MTAMTQQRYRQPLPPQRPTDANAARRRKPLSTLQWWICFGLATYVLSLCFQQFRVFTVTPNWATGGAWLAVIALLALIMLLLGYDSYIHEKRGGKVRNAIPMFDWLEAKGFLTGGNHHD